MKTLFELSSVQRPEINSANSALLIIDAQNEYLSGALPLPGVNLAVAAISKVLKAARREGTPVVHVLHRGSAGGLFDPEGAGYPSIQELRPIAGETVIVKTLPNSFAGTDLHAELQRTVPGKNLVLAGFMTHMCVSSTARAALDLGYGTAIVTDATATRSLRGPDGQTIPALIVHEAALAALQDRISWLVKSSVF
jgi:nicotinamidase-related amidase